MKTFENLLTFLKAPYGAENYSDIKISDFILLLLITMFTVVPYGYFLEWVGIDQFEHIMKEFMEKNKWVLAIFAIFLAPLIEEPIFRLHLDLKKSSIWWGLVLSIFMIDELWYPVILLWGYLIFLYVKISKGEKPNLKIVVYSSSALFALVHMGNFIDFDYGRYFYWVPFLVAIQFVVGLVLSHIRLNHGMKWAIIFHGVYNAVLIIPAVFFYEP
ncbi:CPBP family glutamic-type intramembrane protease [Aquiflexum lacus]|uniref:CPBP family glutamic-type intramembrane protease n=1 Tax=Aquiflexum lacus TaxID=2483805 RepID=UPI00189527B3|nr:CPBP family glutamic-type intramembrane protease [Aquiflexum lacus]